MNPGGPSLSTMLGGALGTHARPGGLWYRSWFWVYLVLTANFVVLMLRQIPCQISGATNYLAGCYSDIQVLWYYRGLQDGQIPFLQSDVEYPVLTGAFMELGRRLVMLFGGRSEPGLDPGQIADASRMFIGITAVLIFALFAVLVWAHLRMHRPWDAMMIAASPAIFTTGLINWDALVVALTSLAILSWARKKPIWTGIWLGLGISAKLYPALLLAPLFILAVRTGKWRAFFTTAAATAGAWLAVNVPVYLASPEGWLYFWTFNVDRGADLGSVWYALQLGGVTIPGLSSLISALMVVGTVAILGLMLFAPTKPRFAQGAFLMVVLFLVLNKVYSPQYVLWLLPLLVLARPRWRDWIMFSVAETVYYYAIWAHLDGVLAGDSAGRLYWLAVYFRVGVQLWLASRVIGDILHPENDIVRVPGLDDPDGGIFDRAPDAPWVQQLRDRFRARLRPA